MCGGMRNGMCFGIRPVMTSASTRLLGHVCWDMGIRTCVYHTCIHVYTCQVNMCMRISTHLSIHMSAHISIHLSEYPHTCICKRYVYANVCAHGRTYLYTPVSVCAITCVCTCLCICTCTYPQACNPISTSLHMSIIKPIRMSILMSLHMSIKCVHTHVYIRADTHVHAHVSVDVCTHAYISSLSACPRTCLCTCPCTE